MPETIEYTASHRDELISQLESMASGDLTETLREVKRRRREGEPDNRRGYATMTLPVVSMDDERYWSVSDAARLLGPPDLSDAQVRQLIHLFGFQPAGKRNGGSRRRHVRVYDAEKLARAYAAIASVLETV
jgi:hypothetical protein